MPDKHNTFQIHLINPWKIVSDTASLLRDVSPTILAEAAGVIFSCFSLLKPLSQGGQAFPHLLALLEKCSDSCLAWEAANTCFGSAMNVFFPPISAILSSTLLSWLAMRRKIHRSHISTLDMHLYFCSLMFRCVTGLNHSFVGCRLPSHTHL